MSNVFELLSLTGKLANQRKRAAILRKAGDALQRLRTDPAEVQWLHGHANQADQDIVLLQRSHDNILAELKAEGNSKPRP